MNRWPPNRYAEHVTPRQSLVVTVGRMEPGPLPPLVDRIAPTLAGLPGDIGAALKRDFWKRHNADSEWSTKYAAQEWLATEVAEFEREKIHRAFDEEEIRALAQRWSELCGKMLRLEVMQDFARSVGIEAPEVKGNVSRCGAARRLSCPRWWRRQIRKHYTRRAESHLRASGFVHKRRQVYASDRAVDNRRARAARNRNLLQELVAVSDAGDQLELWDVVGRSQANPALRRAELMTRLRGFEEIAQAAGHVAEFFTGTCPSAYHRMHDNGTKNDRWQGFTPREGQDWLCKMWARARSRLRRLKVRFYGFRIAEPHHDGTPHWHMVLFAAPMAAELLQKVLRAVWLSEYHDEPGAAKCRSKFVRIDPAKGSACGYVAKYVAKNIDGFEVGDDHETEGKAATESVDRVAAWASAHGVRQFQQLGGPPVSVWRELRRLRGVELPCDAMERARAAADAGEWAAFVAALGGIECGRQGDVGLWAEVTGELSQYDELRGPQVAGVQAVARALRVEEIPDSNRWRLFRRVRYVASCAVTQRVRTRCKVWRIERKRPEASAASAGRSASRSEKVPASPLGPVSITVRGSTTVPSSGGTGARRSGSIRGSPWTH